MNETEQGVREQQKLTDDQFKDEVAKRFHPFWDLHDILVDRSSTRPVFDSDLLDLEADEDNSTPSDDCGEEPHEDDDGVTSVLYTAEAILFG